MYQKGSVRPHPKNKKLWVVRWYFEERRPDGSVKKRRPSKNLPRSLYPNKSDCKRWLEENHLSELNDQHHQALEPFTFKKFAEHWKKTVLIHKKESTRDVLPTVIRHLVEAFGAFKMKDITHDDLQAAISTWTADRKWGGRYVRNHIGVMKTIWKKARASGKVSKSHNPFLDLELPQKEKTKVHNFTPEEMIAIIERADPYHKLMFEILARTGMRPGELAGIRVDHCYDRRIHIEYTVYRKNYKNSPKTKESERWYTISAALTQKIVDHVAKYGENRYGLLFVGRRDGKPINMVHLRRRILNPILEELGILERLRAEGKRIGNYAFRHGVITNLRKKGVKLTSVQAMVGHVEGSDATDGYTHLDGVATDAELMIADLMEEILTPKPKLVENLDAAATFNLRKIS